MQKKVIIGEDQINKSHFFMLLKQLTDEMVLVAQKYYDAWYDDELDHAGNGISFEIAYGMSKVINTNEELKSFVYYDISKLKSYVLVYCCTTNQNFLFKIEIPTYFYQTNKNFYSKMKVDNVKFTENMIKIEDISDVFEKYVNANSCMPLTESKKKLKLNKPFRTSDGPKKFAVYVKDGDKIKIVRFGDPNLSVKLQNPQKVKSFVARHDCKNKTDKTKPSYWSCNLPKYVENLGLKKVSFKYW